MPVVLIEVISEQPFPSIDAAQAHLTATIAIPREGKPYHSWSVIPDDFGFRTSVRFEPEERIPVEEYDARRRAGQLPELQAGQIFIVDSL